eukprot:5156285-Prymnesium_polylepis.1
MAGLSGQCGAPADNVTINFAVRKVSSIDQVEQAYEMEGVSCLNRRIDPPLAAHFARAPIECAAPPAHSTFGFCGRIPALHSTR